MPKPKIVSRDEWTTVRKRLLVKEKELTRQRRSEEHTSELQSHA